MKRTNTILAVLGLGSSVAAYQCWRLLWDDFCYQCLGLSLLFLFALGYNAGGQVYWVRKTMLIGVFWGLYNLFDEWFLNPMGFKISEYVSAGLVVFFIFTKEIYIFLRHTIRSINQILSPYIKALFDGLKGRNGRLRYSTQKKAEHF